RTGNEAMTVGGTGDVLAGIVAALLAKKVEPFKAACMGSFINGYAGDLVFKEKSYSLLATDIIEKIPMVLKEFL
ncbi:MAG: NAD(P)H-hydrate dehydratase, partial [Candidatus Thermoplasmatota archaeon]|nr:NAD(P)H-hydrate dehydratase [Candidatus Thermoplasmatota archaeon]